MMAVAKHFEKKEAEKAFRLFVNWSVRFLISGGGRGGTVETAYNERAAEIIKGEIETADALYKALSKVIPNDTVFRDKFQTAFVLKSHFARYYLRALELTKKGMSEPELVPNEDTVITLEHILPRVPDKDCDSDAAKSIYQRIGNMVLLKSSQNGAIGSKDFNDKKETFKSSPYLLTNMVAKYEKWNIEQINERQKELADLAV